MIGDVIPRAEIEKMIADELETKLNQDLADKVLSDKKVKGLSADDKRRIYFNLTGKHPVIKKGRPTNLENDVLMAREFIENSDKKLRSKIKSELEKKYQLGNTSGSCTKNTFNSALNRGLKELKELCTSRIMVIEKWYEHRQLETLATALNKDKRTLELIAAYELQNAPLKRK